MSFMQRLSPEKPALSRDGGLGSPVALANATPNRISHVMPFCKEIIENPYL